MPKNNWGEVLDAMRGLDTKIATPIKTAIALLGELQDAEGALNEATKNLGTIQARITEADAARRDAAEQATIAQRESRIEIERCKTAIAEAQGREQDALRKTERVIADLERQVNERRNALAAESAGQVTALEAEIRTLTSQRDRLVGEIDTLRARVQAL